MRRVFGEIPTGKHPEVLARCEYIDLNTRDLFWLEPEALHETTGLINNTSMGTMLLAAASRKGDIETLREQLEGVIAVENDNERDELADAIEFGFIYGGVAAKKTLELCSEVGASTSDEPHVEVNTEVDENLWTLLRSAITGIDINSLGGLSDAFMRVRDIELIRCHSDVLSFMLASAQDHIADEFYRYRANAARPEDLHEEDGSVMNTASDETQNYSKLHSMRLQTLFYVGALVGAYANTTAQQRDKDSVQIMRSAHPTGETVSARLELEREESLEVLQYYMANKLRMRVYGGHDESDVPRVQGITVMHQGLQIGPNMLSMPLCMYENEVSADIPRDNIRGVFIEEVDADGKKQLVLYGADYLDDWRDDPVEVRGFVTGNTCVGTFDVLHPMSDAMLQLAQQHIGSSKSAVEYANDFNLVLPEERLGLQPMSRARAAIILGATLFAEWTPELVAYLTHQPEHPRPVNAVALNVITILGASVFGRARRHLRAGEEEIRILDDNFQTEIDRRLTP